MVVTRRAAMAALQSQQLLFKKEMKPKATKKSPPPPSSPQSPSGSGVRRRAIRPIDRKKMRQWLLDKLDGGEMPDHLWWVNSGKTFAVKWPHAARHGFQVDDARLFRAWAEHSGIYKVGDEEDHKKWKSNFRCALRSVPDIKEITEKDQRKGQKAARIYQLLDEPREKKPRKELSRRHIKKFVVKDETCEKSEEKMEEEDWESESSGTGSRSDQPKIPVPGPQDCNIPDFSRLGVSTSGLAMTTCIQTNHLSGGSFREIKAESTSPPVTPTSTTPSYPIPNTTYSVTIPFPVPTPTFDIPISISTPTSTSSGCSLDFADELPKDSMMRPVAIMTRRARTPSGDSGHPDSPRHEELLKPQDGQTFLAIDLSDEGIVLIDADFENNSINSPDDWELDLLDISTDNVPVAVLTEEVETCGEDFDFTSLQEAA